ncbi:MAG: HesA/MoeB/ThiF family protein [Spirochaetota bacterium]|nr:HesA/MoeB/ThiF family protein [Spirochaetota bacterium]
MKWISCLLLQEDEDGQIDISFGLFYKGSHIPALQVENHMIAEKEQERYRRQILVDDIGIEGQEKLQRSSILISGAGGLGSPISYYLAAAGVGNLRIVDHDEVSLSNLNRQILYLDRDIGRKKASAAQEKMQELNPSINIEGVVGTITEDNVIKLLHDCDIILDALDNFPTRYLLNQAALNMNIPYIYGGIYGLEGALTTMIPGETACLRCIFPVAPPSTITPVLGTTSGIIGCLQAMEAIKLIVGIGKLLTNRLMVFDGINMKFREVKLNRNTQCQSCSTI